MTFSSSIGRVKSLSMRTPCSRLPEEQGRKDSMEQVPDLEDGYMVGIVEAPGGQQEAKPSSWGWDPDRWRERQQSDDRLRTLSRWLEQGRELTPTENKLKMGRAVSCWGSG